ncbi:MAG: hypothetical protein KDB69_01615, partial [Acidimicrobiia bacterium]|nr:hypothetical protein [Acidimicrobiia bacterium]
YQSDAGRIAVLRIGKAATDAPPERSEISSIVVPDGLSLGWTELGMRYELFCRSEVSADLCLHVAESASPLEDIR